MLQVALIGQLNQTNALISEAVGSLMEAKVDLHHPRILLKPDIDLDENRLDLLIIDLNTASGFGNVTNIIQKIVNILPSLPILVLHSYTQKKLINPLIEAGASGIISPTPSEDELYKAIQTLLNGESYYSHFE